ncbi:MAG: rRNA maturation RNase YbeY [Cyclobacteriaceae bacterium]
MHNIHYFSEDIEFSLKDQPTISEWITDIISSNECQIEEVNYIFCSDEYLLGINKQYLNHDTYTDIITFDNSSEESLVESDIYISVDRVRENAAEFNISFDKELHRVMIHGVLHLLGWEDKSPDDKKRMTEKEDACLSLLSITN